MSNEEKIKTAEIIASIKQTANTVGSKTIDISKNVAGGVKKGTIALIEKTKKDGYERRMKKYNPLFQNQYSDEKFNLPNMIVIVDDAIRKGIDVCEGSMGWINKEGNIEVLYLYDEEVTTSGLSFVPTATCDAVYYVDNFDRKKFINIDCIFAKAHEERMAELEHIAFSLGAKRCSIEIVETSVEKKFAYKNIDTDTKVKSVLISGKSHESGKMEYHMQSSVSRSGKIVTEFEGRGEPVVPELKWFAYDDNINRLIEMRCTQNNTIKSKVLEIQGSSSATMSQKTACAIDNALTKIDSKTSMAMESQANRELYSKLIFEVEF